MNINEIISQVFGKILERYKYPELQATSVIDDKLMFAADSVYNELIKQKPKYYDLDTPQMMAESRYQFIPSQPMMITMQKKIFDELADNPQQARCLENELDSGNNTQGKRGEYLKHSVFIEYQIFSKSYTLRLTCNCYMGQQVTSEYKSYQLEDPKITCNSELKIALQHAIMCNIASMIAKGDLSINDRPLSVNQLHEMSISKGDFSYTMDTPERDSNVVTANNQNDHVGSAIELASSINISECEDLVIH